MWCCIIFQHTRCCKLKIYCPHLLSLLMRENSFMVQRYRCSNLLTFLIKRLVTYLLVGSRFSIWACSPLQLDRIDGPPSRIYSEQVTADCSFRDKEAWTWSCNSCLVSKLRKRGIVLHPLRPPSCAIVEHMYDNSNFTVLCGVERRCHGSGG